MAATRPLRWGILGTGGIARVLAEAIHASETAELTAVGSRRQETADAFGDQYRVPKRYDSYDAVLADPEVDVVYISLPNHLHREWSIRCAEASKHILCEKPLALSQADVAAMLDAAEKHDVFFLEAFMYRCSPQTQKLVEVVKDGAIGEVRYIQASFCYQMGPKYDNIRLMNAAGGGGLMDVGCYTMSMARLLAGAAHSKDFEDPVQIKGFAHTGDISRVDEWTTATVRFPGDILANLVCATQVSVPAAVSVWGSEGNIQVPNPWFPGRNAGEAMTFTLNRAGHDPETITVPGGPALYVQEVDTVVRHLDRREVPSPAMTHADSLGQQKALDAWRAEIGLVFDPEARRRRLKRTEKAMSHKVGLRTVPYEDTTRSNWQRTGARPLLTDIWYPAVPDASETPVFIGPPEYTLFVAGNAARDADLVSGGERFPLIALSHGTGGTALGLGWLASALAARGYIVAGVNHHGNTAVEAYAIEGFARIWERPLDVTVLLNHLLADPTFGPHIDSARIGAAGFSLGGYTALALAGGLLDLPHLLATYAATGRDLADDMPPEFADRQALANLLIRLAHEDTSHKQSYRDAHVRAVFAMAPALGEAFTAEGLAPISIPVQIVVGAADTSTPPASNALRFAGFIKDAATVVLEGQVGHYTFLAECTDLGREALPALCIDSPGVGRRTIHEQVSQLAAQFFDQHLGSA